MTLIWATRGRAWGFKFLRDGGFLDPLPEYEKAFSDRVDEREVWCRVGGSVAVRFSDPIGRKDRAGRSIIHDFVVAGPLAEDIHSVEDGVRQLWPLVAEEFEQLWDRPMPPS